jgi:phenylacetic acid degradation operon negative regulatory protein
MSHRTQDLLFTLFGEYMRARGGEIWVGSLIDLMDCLGVSAQAVRSTLSRMVRKSWLRTRQAGRNSYYSLTPKSIAVLEEGSQRIFHPRKDPWDGQWYILVYSIPEKQRHLRVRLRQRLVWMGFGLLSQATWIAPRDLRQEVEAILDQLEIRPYVESFHAGHLGFSSDQEIVERCWNLNALNQCYADFIDHHECEYQSLLEHPEGRTPCGDFTRRFNLVHDYRSLPYVDPNLPAELLPEGWLGDKAILLFQSYHDLLAGTAEAFVSSVLARSPESHRVQ